MRRFCISAGTALLSCTSGPLAQSPTPPPISSSNAQRSMPPSAPARDSDDVASGAPVSFGPPSSLIRSDGTVLGEVRAAQLDRGIAFGIVARNMTPGIYRLYIHSTGRCSPPAFDSAGPPWLPPKPVGYGIPDLGLVTAGSDGTVYETHVAQGLKLHPDGPVNLLTVLDADGAALVIHSPGGTFYEPPRATSRVACAVVR